MEEYRLDTPEALTVTFDVAGIGSRCLAALIDFAIWIVLLIVVGLMAFALAQAGDLGQTAAQIVFISAAFVIFFGYYIILESAWRGRTPGKVALSLRVIDTQGYPIGFTESAIRNLVRIVDFLPAFYGVGVIAMFISSESRRLGDYAAGTIVIKERTVVLPQVSSQAMPQPAPGTVDPDELQWNLAALSPEDLAIISQFVDRARTLREPARQRLAGEIAARVRDRIGAREPLDPVGFLNRVLWLVRNRGA